jgi:hypothetical protein
MILLFFLQAQKTFHFLDASNLFKINHEQKLTSGRNMTIIIISTLMFMFALLTESFMLKNSFKVSFSGKFQLNSLRKSILDLDTIKSSIQDISAIGMPKVIAGGDDVDWQMWFHYRDSTIDEKVVKLSSGKIGYATSSDGISNWKLHPESPVLLPSKVSGDW